MKNSTLEKALSQHAPDLAIFYDAALHLLKQGESAKEELETLYKQVKKISIDYAVMEHWTDLVMARSDFDWDDVGSWTSMKQQMETDCNGNAVRGLHVGLDTRNSLIVSTPNHFVATVGLDNAIVVHTEDATLVCNAASAQRIKELIQLIEKNPNLHSFL